MVTDADVELHGLVMPSQLGPNIITQLIRLPLMLLPN